MSKRKFADDELVVPSHRCQGHHKFFIGFIHGYGGYRKNRYVVDVLNRNYEYEYTDRFTGNELKKASKEQQLVYKLQRSR